MSSLPATYKAAFYESANTPLVFKDVELKHPGPGQVLIKTVACGVCFSDVALKRGWLGDVFPRIPGHEVVGDVVEVGPNVTRFKGGERVGGGWHGGHDGTCRSCQRGQFQMCEHQAVNGVSQDGGYAEYCILREEAVVRVPKEMDPAQVAPLLCAGVTVFNAMRKLNVEAGNLVAVQGLGGLGHLAVQYASKMGYRVVALSSGDDKRDFAKELGADEYINTKAEDAAEKLQSMGGAAMIVATAPNPKAVSPLVGGIQRGGKLLVLAPVGPVEVDSTRLVIWGISVHGWPCGHALDTEETIDFSLAKKVECMIEKFPLADAQKATEHLESGNPRFRCVLIA